MLVFLIINYFAHVLHQLTAYRKAAPLSSTSFFRTFISIITNPIVIIIVEVSSVLLSGYQVTARLLYAPPSAFLTISVSRWKSSLMIKILLMKKKIEVQYPWGRIPRGVMANVLDSAIVESTFEFHFRTNNLAKVMNPLMPLVVDEMVPLLFFYG